MMALFLTIPPFTIAWRSISAQTPSSAALSATTSPSPLATGLTLAALLDSVAARHPLVAASRARVRAAEASRTTAGFLGNPIIGYQVDNTPFPGSGPVAMPLGMERESMTTATLPLESIYQRAPRVRRADAQLRAVRADAVGERQRIARAAAHAFYRTALAQTGVDVSRDVASWLDTLVAYNRKRVDEGAAAEADLIRSQLERDRALADQTMQEAELARARAGLSPYLGDATSPFGSATHNAALVDAGPAPLPLVLAGPGDSSAMTPTRRARADSLAGRNPIGLDQRPDVLSARERVTAASAGVATERWMLVRQLGATIGVKRSGGTSTMIAGVSIPLPLFDQNRGEVARAQAERDEAQYMLADRERGASAEIDGAREAARLLTDRVLLLAGPTTADAAQSTSSFLARADEARRIALGAYREGAVPLIQVLDAARAWGEARLAYYRTLYGQHESVLDLLVARGIDLREALGPDSSRNHLPGTR